MPTTLQGYFLIADITGYTSYLSKSELDHAQQTLTALLNLLIKHTKPPLVISRLAGDAVISYGLRDNFFQGQTFIELIEDTYVAFRRAIELMVLNTTCNCNACANINSLDLKFFVHYGSFSIQKLDYHDEMVGADVIVIHRLLKNTVSETFGYKAYCLYTEAALNQLQLQEFRETMQPHQEQYEHLGSVPVWIQDLHPVWQAKVDRVEVSVPPEVIVFAVEANIALPLETVWDYLMQPEFRRLLIGSDRQVIEARKGGRVSEGSVYRCYHGEMLIRQTVIAWIPFERVITQDLIPVPFSHISAYVEYRLFPSENGTRLVQAVSKAITGPYLARLITNAGLPARREQFDHHIQTFKKQIEADYSQQAAVPAGIHISSQSISTAVAESLAE